MSVGALIGLLRGLAQNRLVLVLLAAVLLVTLVGAKGFGLTLASDPEESYQQGAFTGHVHLAGGIDNLGDTYVTSGEPGFKSQSIVAQGSITLTGDLGILPKFCDYQYRVFVKDATGHERAAPWLDSGILPAPGALVVGGTGKTFPLQSHTFTLDPVNTPRVGALRVELWIHEGHVTCRDEPEKAAQDGAILKDGAGYLRLTAGQSQKFENGDVVYADVASGEGHWSVSIFDGAGNLRCEPTVTFDAKKIIKLQALDSDGEVGAEHPFDDGTTTPAWNPGDPAPAAAPALPTPTCADSLHWDGSREGQIHFALPPNAFLEGGKNVWILRLANHLVEHAIDAIVVLDKKTLAPAPPKIDITTPGVEAGQSPEVGQTVHFVMSATMNPQTKLPIDHFLFYAWYGGSDQLPVTESPAWIVNGAAVPAVRLDATRWTGDYAVVITQAAESIRTSIMAVDTAGRPSGSLLNQTDRHETAVAYNVTDEEIPTSSRPSVHIDNGNNSPPPTGPGAPAPASTGIPAIVGAVLAALLAYLVIRFLPAPMPVKIIAVLVLLGAIAYVTIRGI